MEHPAAPDCAQVQTAIWARPGAVYDAATNRTYVATGNGDFAPASHAWGESVLALNPDGTGTNGGPLDSYTPAEYGQLNDTDADIGSTEPAILPTLPSGAHRHLGVQGGKDAMLRLLDMDNLSGQHATGRTGGALQVLPLPQGGDVLSSPAVWTDAHGTIWVFVSTSSGISGLRLVTSGATPRLQPVWQSGAGGFSPAIDHGVLYYAGPGNLWALDAATGRTLRHNGGIGYIHWQSPRVAGGTVYLTDGDNRLSAFAAVGRRLAAVLIPDWLGRRAIDRPASPALIVGPRSWSYADLDARATALAGHLAALGVRQGDRVGTLLRNGPHVAVAVHALIRLGAILVPLNLRLAESEIAWQVRRAGVGLLLHDEDTARPAGIDVPWELLARLEPEEQDAASRFDRGWVPASLHESRGAGTAGDGEPGRAEPPGSAAAGGHGDGAAR